MVALWGGVVVASEPYEKSREQPLRPATPPAAFHAVPPPSLPPATLVREPLRPWADEEASSRLPPLGAGARPLLWKGALRAELRPRHLLASGDRILVQGGSAWQLFDGAGRALATDSLGPGAVTIDAGWFYVPKPSGKLGARRLPDGAEGYTVSLPFGDQMTRQRLWRAGPLLGTVSVERPLDPIGNHQPSLSVLEIDDLGTPPAIDKRGGVSSARTTAKVKLDSARLVSARHGERLVVAVPGAIYYFDGALRLLGSVRGDGEPLALSLDESGAAHLIVSAGGGRALWSFAPDGGRWCAVALPADLGPPAAPPIIGYDHRLFVAGRHSILAFERDGRLAWRQTLPEEIAGAAVTADGQLLVAAGPRVLALDGAGQARVVATAGERIETPPILTASGLLLVASLQHLYAFALPR